MTIPLFAAEYIVVDADRDWWCTPRWLVDVVRDALGGQIDLDPCSNPRSVVGASYTIEAAQDGLSSPWHAPIRGYCNPPYSDPEPWVRRCADEADLGSLWVGCIKSDTSTAWWHAQIWSRAKAVCFPRRRVDFIPPPGIEASTANFPRSTAVLGAMPRALRRCLRQGDEQDREDSDPVKKRRRSRKQVWKYADGKLAEERQRIAESAAQWREEEAQRVDEAYEAARRIADERLAAVMDTAGTRYE